MAVPPEHSTVRHTYDAHRGGTTAGCDDALDGRAEATQAGAMRGPPGPGGGIRPRWSLSSSRAVPPAAEQGGMRKPMASPRAGKGSAPLHGGGPSATTSTRRCAAFWRGGAPFDSYSHGRPRTSRASSRRCAAGEPAARCHTEPGYRGSSTSRACAAPPYLASHRPPQPAVEAPGAPGGLAGPRPSGPPVTPATRAADKLGGGMRWTTPQGPLRVADGIESPVPGRGGLPHRTIQRRRMVADGIESPAQRCGGLPHRAFQ